MREGHLRLILDILDGLCSEERAYKHEQRGVVCRYCHLLANNHEATCPIQLNALLQESRDEILVEGGKEP